MRTSTGDLCDLCGEFAIRDAFVTGWVFRGGCSEGWKAQDQGQDLDEFCESTTDEVFEVYHCTAQPLEWNLNSERKAWTEVVA